MFSCHSWIEVRISLQAGCILRLSIVVEGWNFFFLGFLFITRC